MCIMLDIDSSSRFPFKALTQQRHTHKVTDATDHFTRGLATAGVDNYSLLGQTDENFSRNILTFDD